MNFQDTKIKKKFQTVFQCTIDKQNMQKNNYLKIRNKFNK